MGVAALFACSRPHEASLPAGSAVGERAPALSGVHADGSAYHLPAGSESRLIYFYRGGDCGLCRLRLRELERRLPEYRALGSSCWPPRPTRPPPPPPREVGATMTIVSVDSASLAAWGLWSDADAQRTPIFAAYVVNHDGVVIVARRSAIGADRISAAELLTLLEQRRQDDASSAL
jgi:hypothetical protein